MQTGMLDGMSTTQIAVRLSDDLLAAVDRLVAGGTAASRTDAVRRGLRYLIAETERQTIDRAIVDGYARLPQNQRDAAASEASLREAIEQEPW
jgi:Arc/MetJ-type ribon-helix-helix transcriptional regulator